LALPVSCTRNSSSAAVVANMRAATCGTGLKPAVRSWIALSSTSCIGRVGTALT
jgi:hypothetical protein